MSDRSKPHNGRDTGGHFKVRQADVEDLRTEPEGEAHLRDDVRLGGAVEDTGSHAGELGKHIEQLIDENEAGAS
ncbi:MAG: hypothetical protein JWO05_2905 [Gemmatimonadetes bacterium]|nr:hypothetical protein [Gemmatimonadota bacterium]